MITNHRNTARPRLDLPSLALTLIGLVSGVIAYRLISDQHMTVLIIVPAVVAVTIGITHLIKREAPRE